MRAAILAGLLALAPAAAAADPTGEAAVKAGASLYSQMCSHCHGIGMVNPGNSSFDLRTFPKEEHERFVQVVAKGKDKMPAWGDILTPQEIEQLWAYVATRAGKEPMPQGEASGKQGSLVPAPPPAMPENRAAGTGFTPVSEGALTACLPLNGGVLSGRRSTPLGGAGFDVSVLAEAAARLGRTLSIVWIESEPEKESDPPRETHAMLSLPLCDVVAGVPHLAVFEAGPPGARAAPPRWEGRPVSWDPGRQVDLVPVALTRPVYRATIGLVVDTRRTGECLPADWDGLALGLAQGTLAGTLGQLGLPPAAKARAVTRPPGARFLWDVEAGRFPAALVDLAAWDDHRRQNPVTPLRLAPWRASGGLDIAYAVRASDPGLREALDAAIADLTASGALARMAEEAGLTLVPPEGGAPAERLTLAGWRAIAADSFARPPSEGTCVSPA